MRSYLLNHMFRNLAHFDADNNKRGVNVIVAHYIGSGNLIGNVSNGKSK